MAWWNSADKIGINLNEWQYPVNEFSRADGNLEGKLRSLDCIGEFNFSRRIWDNATTLVDEVLNMLLVEINKHASKFEGLVFDSYRKQGSSREGLKIRNADEFDVLLEYHIDGLSIQHESISDERGIIPGLGKIKILNPSHEVESRFPTWLRKKIIDVNNGSYFLNARILHQTVFESLLDKCRENITGSESKRISFDLLRSMNPPSVNLTIKVTQNKGGFWGVTEIPDVIDIDVVPAMIIMKEKAKGTSDFMDCQRNAVVKWMEESQARASRFDNPAIGGFWEVTEIPHVINTFVVVPPMIIMKGKAKGTSDFMDCPRYAVVKWMEESQARASRFENPAMIWRLCTSGYEKHYMDLARNDKQKLYIMTACRIVKTFMSKEKESRLLKQNPLPISTFLRSFYLKNIAFYCMLFIRSVSGVHEALGHFLGFLKISLEMRNLPQFFHGNNLLRENFPSCAQGERFNLFEHASPDTFINACHSFVEVLSRLSGMYNSSALESDGCAKFKEYLSR